MQKLTYLKTFLKDKNVGAVVKSSRFAVSKICDSVDLSGDVVIVEYGPGDGVLTRELLSRITKGSRIIAIETNPFFVEHLASIGDKRLSVVHDSVERLPSILKSKNIEYVDYVFSGIPFSFLNKTTRFLVTEQTKKSLREGGSFVVYQYSPLMAKYMKKVFGSVRIGFIPLNLPSYFLI